MADETLPVPPFAVGFGFGLLVIPLSLAAATAGAALGWSALVLLTLAAALAGRRFSFPRVLGVLTGLLTVVLAGFVLLAPLMFGDW